MYFDISAKLLEQLIMIRNRNNTVADYFTRAVILCLFSNLLQRNTFGALLRFSGL